MSPGQVKPKDYIKFVFAASPLSKEHSGGSASSSWLRIRRPFHIDVSVLRVKTVSQTIRIYDLK